ncbi:MAG: ethylbenzene dehydrogenase-related protein [Bacteroidota bacterium]
MKNQIIAMIALVAIFTFSCNNNTEDPPVDPGESSSELLVKKFTAAPVLDGEIDEMWGTVQKLVSSTVVPSNLGDRMTYYNEDGIGEETIDIFEGYEGEEYNFTMRSGYVGEDIYFLIEWEDADDSKDRQSWYFDATSKLWKGEHKYANASNDKYYEDKFSFLFPIGEVDGFSTATCYATCHAASTINTTKDKHTRHYLKGVDQKVDMWHWKRVRGTYADQVDDQQMVYKEGPYTSSTNGRTGDTDGVAGYAGNSQTLNNGTADVSVPMYVIPDQTDYYWIDKDQIADGTAKLITAVDADGVLTYDGGTIDPAGGGYEQGVGIKRIPSVTTKAFEGTRADISVKAVHTGTGWVCEVKRKLNTGDPSDVVFNPAEELPFGFAIFGNAAIAHAIKPGLNMKFEQ